MGLRAVLSVCTCTTWFGTQSSKDCGNQVSHLWAKSPDHRYRVWKCSRANTATICYLRWQEIKSTVDQEYEVNGTRYGVSDKGWVDQELFHHWLKDHFLSNAVTHLFWRSNMLMMAVVQA